MRRLKDVVDEQTADEGLWFKAETAPEAYLQRALRKLHTHIEAEFDAAVQERV
jgi:hypothetical protein